VQSCHSAFEAASLYDGDEHPSVILCAVKNKEKLEAEWEKIQTLGFPCKEFYENDLNDELTSFCVIVPDESRPLMRKYQLLRSSHVNH
jgi:hypothetical protein